MYATRYVYVWIVKFNIALTFLGVLVMPGAEGIHDSGEDYQEDTTSGAETQDLDLSVR
jgi:hypothetical protein